MRSVPSQISEGFRKSSLKEKHRFYEIADTSNDETENHLNEAKNNNYIDEKIYKHYLNRIIRVRILLSRLRKSVRSIITARQSQSRKKSAKTVSMKPNFRSEGAK